MPHIRLIRSAALSAAMFAIWLLPGRAEAQFSAIGQGTLEDSPVFTSSALVHERGGYSIGGFFARAMTDLDTALGELSSDRNIFGFGGAVGVTDRLTVGASVPFISEKAELDDEEVFDESGIGDAALFGGWQFWRSADERTKLAAQAGVSLPTGKEELGLGNETSVGVGGALSHQAEQVSFHAALGVEFVSVDVPEEAEEEVDDSRNDFNYSAALVVPVTDNLNLSGEFFGTKFDTDDDDLDTFNALGVAARWIAGAGGNVFLDGGVAFGLGDDAFFDTAFLVGVTFVR